MWRKKEKNPQFLPFNHFPSPPSAQKIMYSIAICIRSGKGNSSGSIAFSTKCWLHKIFLLLSAVCLSWLCCLDWSPLPSFRKIPRLQLPILGRLKVYSSQTKLFCYEDCSCVEAHPYCMSSRVSSKISNINLELYWFIILYKGMWLQATITVIGHNDLSNACSFWGG